MVNSIKRHARPSLRCMYSVALRNPEIRPGCSAKTAFFGTLDCLTKPPRRLIKGRALFARLYHQGKHDEVRYHPGKKVYQHDSHGSTETSICGSFKPRLACALQRTHTPAFLQGEQSFRVDQRVRNKLNQRIVVRSLEAIQIPRARPATQQILQDAIARKARIRLTRFSWKNYW